MESTGNFYEHVREGDTTKTNAKTVAETKNPQTEISDSSKWASRIFTTLAIVGWVVVIILILDIVFFNSRLMEWIMIAK